MSKFKVEDKVRLKSIEKIRKIDKDLNGIDEEYLKGMEKDIWTIKSIDESGENVQFYGDMREYWFKIDFLKKVYSYSFKQLPDDYCGELTIRNGEVIKREDTYELLTKSEREYLRTVIEPFREKIKYISKRECFPNGTSSIMIAFKDPNSWHMDFPDFEIGTMYKGLKAIRKYTLEELDL